MCTLRFQIGEYELERTDAKAADLARQCNSAAGGKKTGSTVRSESTDKVAAPVLAMLAPPSAAPRRNLLLSPEC